jgi:tRNA(Ile2) C34 agmatinyltransferase TiaS
VTASPVCPDCEGSLRRWGDGYECRVCGNVYEAEAVARGRSFAPKAARSEEIEAGPEADHGEAWERASEGLS